jgi:hypothetical protein
MNAKKETHQPEHSCFLLSSKLENPPTQTSASEPF